VLRHRVSGTEHLVKVKSYLLLPSCLLKVLLLLVLEQATMASREGRSLGAVLSSGVLSGNVRGRGKSKR
jgi:hypothetical protein